MRKALILISAVVSSAAAAQELNCEVKVLYPNIQLADPALFKDLETSIREFMTNTKWTNDRFELEERVKCQIVITISEELAIDRFRANISIVSSRPVFNSDYETVIFNHQDQDFVFNYAAFQPLEYSEGFNLSNLTSVLAYYAYVILGLDYDSFSRNGGTAWFLKAQAIVNMFQGTGEAGWQSSVTRSRYWLVENLLNSRYAAFRTAFYTYHLKALDEFYTNPSTSTRTLISALSDLDRLNKDQPNSMIVQVFFNSKKQELKDIFAGAPPAEKTKAVNLLCSLDPARCEEYRKAIS